MSEKFSRGMEVPNQTLLKVHMIKTNLFFMLLTSNSALASVNLCLSQTSTRKTIPSTAGKYSFQTLLATKTKWKIVSTMKTLIRYSYLRVFLQKFDINWTETPLVNIQTINQIRGTFTSSSYKLELWEELFQTEFNKHHVSNDEKIPLL